ncbi:TetR family transcriptional regulator [Knoellia remsis]|uniref:TetR family transcriptional regulator n=1 Tax=Knoellia remsis TaxID=407159 RepID=A0A2T0UGN2_9MICO|nr:TetR family transcriptional regulator [Knoellia remsis]PRY57018.1 TetR family transcriptional regulator [Knoellia remsis]
MPRARSTSTPRARAGRPGPRAGRPGPRADVDTKARILEAARTSFSESGYAATTLRGVAATAGVDVALIPYYFGKKQDLFTAAMDIPVRPAELIDGAFADGVARAGARLVSAFLDLWEAPETGPALLTMFRTAMTDDAARRSFTEFIASEILASYARHLDTEDAELRASLAATQLLGMVMVRCVLRIQPVAGLPREQVVALVGPSVQRYLSGPLDE